MMGGFGVSYLFGGWYWGSVGSAGGGLLGVCFVAARVRLFDCSSRGLIGLIIGDMNIVRVDWFCLNGF